MRRVWSAPPPRARTHTAGPHASVVPAFDVQQHLGRLGQQRCHEERVHSHVPVPHLPRSTNERQRVREEMEVVRVAGLCAAVPDDATLGEGVAHQGAGPDRPHQPLLRLGVRLAERDEADALERDPPLRRRDAHSHGRARVGRHTDRCPVPRDPVEPGHQSRGIGEVVEHGPGKRAPLQAAEDGQDPSAGCHLNRHALHGREPRQGRPAELGVHEERHPPGDQPDHVGVLVEAVRIER